MSTLSTSDERLRQLLTTANVIAIVGHSPKPDRPSYQIAQFLRRAGYRIYPVNPGVAKIDDQQCYPAITAIPVAIDIVTVFRRSEFLAAIVEDAIAVQAKTIWTQLDIADEAAAQVAINAGLNVVMNRCIQVEYLRLGINRDP